MSTKNRPLLTIGVMSYNRPVELERLLRSIPSHPHIEIVVSDDSSPNIAAIRSVIQSFISLNITFLEASENQGFDLNLKRMIDGSSGQFVLMMADDDYFAEGALEELVKSLATSSQSLILTGYTDHTTYEVFRVRDLYINFEHARSNGRFTYDLIMISGLIFRAEDLPKYDAKRLVGSIYSQVYLGLLLAAKDGALYYGKSVVQRGQDGPNGFSNTGDPRKADRGRYLSNLAFHEGLIKAVRLADDDLNMNGLLISSFAREYALRTVTGFIMSSEHGRGEVVKYYSGLKGLDLNIGWLPHFVFPVIFLLGKFGTRLTLGVLRKFLLKVRR